MVLIFGGAYQGKLEYAKQEYCLEEMDIFVCDSQTGLDLSKQAIYGLEQFILACVENGIEAKAYLEENRSALEGKILICTDISQGIVPMEKELREWREMTGRAMTYLAGEADAVVRIFCGLPQKLK